MTTTFKFHINENHIHYQSHVLLRAHVAFMFKLPAGILDWERRIKMASALHTSAASVKRPSWHDFSLKFTDQRECLASYLALEAAEVLEGVKPANLISVSNRRRPCGRNLYQLWRLTGREVIAGSGLAAREIVDRGGAVLLLLYSPSAIKALLERPNVAAVLKRSGYEDLSCHELVLDELAMRVKSLDFPHEIGVFLGYPLKDVAAFMGLVQIPFSCQGPWRIFGNPRDSLQLAETFRCCRIRMAERLAGSDSAFACLRNTGKDAMLFLREVIENGNQDQCIQGRV